MSLRLQSKNMYITKLNTSNKMVNVEKFQSIKILLPPKLYLKKALNKFTGQLNPINPMNNKMSFYNTIQFLATMDDYFYVFK